MTAQYQYFAPGEDVVLRDDLWDDLPDGITWSDWEHWDEWDELAEWIDTHCDGWEWWQSGEAITIAVRSPEGEVRTNTVHKEFQATFHSGPEKPLDGGGQ
jgi:hypothetical protein